MKDFIPLLPEIFLAVTFLGIVVGEVGYHGERLRLISLTAIFGLAGALVQTLISYQYGTVRVFSDALSVDGLSLFFKVLFLLLGILAIVASMQTKEILAEKRAEFCALILASTLAMCLTASAADMLLAFLALQAMNVLGYFLAAFGKRNVRSTEAAVKYMLFGVVSGALFLYGIAVLFAYTHSLNMYDMHRALVASPMPRDTYLIVFMMIFLSLAMQIASFPMHFWAPDTLEGAPTPVSSFLAIGPRAAGFALTIRMLIVVFAQPALEPGKWQVLPGLDWTQIVAICAGATMVMGALLAYRQSGAKRLVSYLIMSQTGYLLMGLLILDEVGLAAILYNLVVDLFAVVGCFYVLSFLFDELSSDRLEDLPEMSGRAVPESVCLILFLACLVGLPPFPGFIGKFALVGGAIRRDWHALALLAIISSAFSTMAVARLANSLVGDFVRKGVATGSTPTDAVVVSSRNRRTFLLSLLVPMGMAAVFANWILHWAGQSLRFIFW